MACSVTGLYRKTADENDWRENGSVTTIFTNDTTNLFRYMRGYPVSYNPASNGFLPSGNATLTSRLIWYNQCTRISDSSINCANMFSDCKYFNSEVIIGNNVTDCRNMFSNCTIFNAPIKISPKTQNCDSMFYNCYRFNQSITIPESVTNTSNMFFNCQEFSQEIRIPQNVTSFNFMFGGIPYFDTNKVIIDSEWITNNTIPVNNSSISNVGGALVKLYLPNSFYDINFIYYNYAWDLDTAYQDSYNYAINHPNEENRFELRADPKYGPNNTYYRLLVNGSSTYNSATAVSSFDIGPVRIGDNVRNCVNMLRGYSRFNHPVYFGNNITNLCNTFAYCTSFNQPLNIPDSVLDCSSMFNMCYSLNISAIKIGNNVTNCVHMFNSCTYNNFSINVPESVSNCQNMFKGCRSGNIYLLNGNLTSANITGIISGSPGSYQKNIFCPNIEVINNTSSSYSVTGTGITWTTTTNGYYNTTYNVYIYNNMPSSDI